MITSYTLLRLSWPISETAGVDNEKILWLQGEIKKFVDEGEVVSPML